jgi:hypothetical protein
MHALIQDHAVAAYPYGLAELRRDNPNTSFPRNPSDAVLADWNVFPVVEQSPPEYNPATQNLNQVNPTLIEGTWVMTWAVTPATPAEIAERTEAKATEVREQRNQLLSACDWTQGKDIPDSTSDLWAPYRQDLRDIPEQPGFPWDVTWPTQPE